MRRLNDPSGGKAPAGAARGLDLPDHMMVSPGEADVWARGAISGPVEYGSMLKIDWTKTLSPGLPNTPQVSRAVAARAR